jgi:peptidoglycan/LPS O-acetylase OafA/YrhL
MKKHFEILDGLRGLAAIIVTIYHLLEGISGNYNVNPFHHAYLAVDFFFLLSGFVIGHAYDSRWDSMTIAQFLIIRLQRLHPLVILGTVIGALTYIYDPFVGYKQEAGTVAIAIAFILGILLVPAPTLPNRWYETHSLNGPAWSLFQEYLINIFYAFWGRKMKINTLVAFVAVSGITLIITAVHYGDLQGGWSWQDIWVGPVRVTFPFFAGLLICRLNLLVNIKFAFPITSLLLFVVFIVPHIPRFRTNGLFDAACVIVLFPLIISIGAGSQVKGKLASACLFIGQISYPLYLLHYPFVHLYIHWITDKKPGSAIAAIAACTLIFFLIVGSWITLKVYDIPVRKKLASFLNRRSL